MYQADHMARRRARPSPGRFAATLSHKGARVMLHLRARTYAPLTAHPHKAMFPFNFCSAPRGCPCQARA
ncbi:hypothetical protein MTBLM5_370015 [Magnetospirillum sp. LM-5]|nr:hypothetical protein MTBLM5_370015 [Magnetospirillum sp. LM-5]